jgi:hypothetical protein
MHGIKPSRHIGNGLAGPTTTNPSTTNQHEQPKHTSPSSQTIDSHSFHTQEATSLLASTVGLKAISAISSMRFSAALDHFDLKRSMTTMGFLEISVDARSSQLTFGIFQPK